MTAADRLDNLITGLINNGTFIFQVDGLVRDRRYKTGVPNVEYAWLLNRLRDIAADPRAEERHDR